MSARARSAIILTIGGLLLCAVFASSLVYEFRPRNGYDKILHVLAFAPVGACIVVSGAKRWAAAGLFLLSLAAAAGIEIVQAQYVVGRSGSADDFAASAGGLLLGAIGAAIAGFVIRTRSASKHVA